MAWPDRTSCGFHQDQPSPCGHPSALPRRERCRRHRGRAASTRECCGAQGWRRSEASAGRSPASRRDGQRLPGTHPEHASHRRYSFDLATGQTRLAPVRAQLCVLDRARVRFAPRARGRLALVGADVCAHLQCVDAQRWLRESQYVGHDLPEPIRCLLDPTSGGQKATMLVSAAARTTSLPRLRASAWAPLLVDPAEVSHPDPDGPPHMA
jgi:hypothetical protein